MLLRHGQHKRWQGKNLCGRDEEVSNEQGTKIRRNGKQPQTSKEGHSNRQRTVHGHPGQTRPKVRTEPQDAP